MLGTGSPVEKLRQHRKNQKVIYRRVGKILVLAVVLVVAVV